MRSVLALTDVPDLAEELDVLLLQMTYALFWDGKNSGWMDISGLNPGWICRMG